MHATSNSTAVAPMTAKGHLTFSCHILKPTIEPMIATTIRNSIGSMFCFCRSISVKNITPVMTSPPKQTIGTTSIAHPGERKKSIMANNEHEKEISLIDWLMRLYSTKSGDNTSDHAIYMDIKTIRLHALPPRM